MRQKIRQLFQQAFILATAMLITSCNNGYDFNFKTPEEAINTCRKELYELIDTETASTKELAEITNRWIALQDSTIKIMSKETDKKASQITINTFFSVADSIRQQISKIAYSKKRSINDVVYLKVNTVYNEKTIRSSEEYKNAIAFFEGLNSEKLYESPEKAMEEYQRIFKEIEKVKKEKELLDFMRREDICFRSLLKFQSEISLEETEQLADKTEMFFDKLQYAINKQESEDNYRLLAYLNVRINRRIIENAKTCANDIARKKNLSMESRNSYRWILLQPFLSIDKYLAAYLTDDQKEALNEIGKNLPDYLNYLDETKVKVSKKDKENLKELLTNSLLSMYLKQNI